MDYSRMGRLELEIEINKLNKELEKYRKSEGKEFIKEYNDLVAKCNELSLENSRLKRDISDAATILNRYPELVRSISGKVIIEK